MGSATLQAEDANRLRSPISDVTTGIGDVRSGYATYGKGWESDVLGLISAEDLAAIYDGAARRLDVASTVFYVGPEIYWLPSGRVLVRTQDRECRGDRLTLYTSIDQYKTAGHAGEVYAGNAA